MAIGVYDSGIGGLTVYKAVSAHFKDDDLIIWHDEIEQVTKTERFCSDAQKPVYYRCETKPRKSDTEIFLKNFYKAIGKKWKGRRN